MKRSENNLYLKVELIGSLFFRCYAALGDVSKARYLRELSTLAHKIQTETVRVKGCRVLEWIAIL